MPETCADRLRVTDDASTSADALCILANRGCATVAVAVTVDVPAITTERELKADIVAATDDVLPIRADLRRVDDDTLPTTETLSTPARRGCATVAALETDETAVT
jgi:hypothetical protein